MNPEKLQDVLNQLPDDLIAAADALRQRKKAPVVWKRVLPAAACFVLVLGVLYIAGPYLGFRASSKEAAVMQDAAISEMELLTDEKINSVAGDPESPAEAAPREETNREPGDDAAPLAPEMEEQADATGTSVVEVTSCAYHIGAEEPDETQITIISTLGEWERYLADNPRLTEEGGFENTYGEAYFDDKQLIAVITTAASSSVRYEFSGLLKTGTGTWELTGTRYRPEWFTDDMEQQCILVELPRTVEPEDIVVLKLENSTE